MSVICGKYRKFKTPKTSYNFWKNNSPLYYLAVIVAIKMKKHLKKN